MRGETMKILSALALGLLLAAPLKADTVLERPEISIGFDDENLAVSHFYSPVSAARPVHRTLLRSAHPVPQVNCRKIQKKRQHQQNQGRCILNAAGSIDIGGLC